MTIKIDTLSSVWTISWDKNFSLWPWSNLATIRNDVISIIGNLFCINNPNTVILSNNSFLYDSIVRNFFCKLEIVIYNHILCSEYIYNFYPSYTTYFFTISSLIYKLCRSPLFITPFIILSIYIVNDLFCHLNDITTYSAKILNFIVMNINKFLFENKVRLNSYFFFSNNTIKGYQYSIIYTHITTYKYYINNSTILIKSFLFILGTLCSSILIHLGYVIYILVSYIIIFIMLITGYNLLKPNVFILFIMLYMSTSSNSLSTRTMDNEKIMALLAFLGNFIYLILGILFDYLSYVNTHNIIYKNKAVSKFILGINYFFLIICSIFASNGLWFFTQNKVHNMLPLTILTGISTILFSALWYLLCHNTNIARFAIINSIFRAICEVLAFNSIAWHTYALWGYWISMQGPYNMLALSIFIPLHLFFSFLTIWSEILGNIFYIYYGILYYLSFGTVCLGVNGLYGLLIKYLSINMVSIVTIVILSILVTILHPPIYRNINNNLQTDIELSNFTSNSTNVNHVSNNVYFFRLLFFILISVFKYLILIICFIFVSGLLYQYI